MSEILPFPSTHADAPAPANGSFISDGTTATFMQDVMEMSLTVPVIVDFWATWCGPCKQLTPLLEKHVNAQQGKVRLVKIDVDKNQELAAQLRIQSMPTVYAFVNGQPVDAFMGLQPDAQIKQFVERLAKISKAPGGAPDFTPLYDAAAAALAEGQIEEAATLYAEILRAVPTEAAAQIGILRIELTKGNIDGVRDAMAQLPPETKKHKDFAQLQAALDLASQAADSGPLDELKAAVDKNPSDHAARYDYAAVLFSAGQVDEAFDQLFDILQKKADWNDGAAKAQVLKFCETLGLEHDASRAARRRLSAIIFK